MGFQIADGTGSGRLAEVDSEHRLKVASVAELQAAVASRNNGLAYSWTHAYDYDANDTILWLKNTSQTHLLMLDTIVISSDTTTQSTVHYPTDTTPAGTLVVGTNLNGLSGNVANALCYGDETGNTMGKKVVQGISLGNTTALMPAASSLILGYNNEIAVDLVTAGTLGIVTIRGYYYEVD